MGVGVGEVQEAGWLQDSPQSHTRESDSNLPLRAVPPREVYPRRTQHCSHKTPCRKSRRAPRPGPALRLGLLQPDLPGGSRFLGRPVTFRWGVYGDKPSELPPTLSWTGAFPVNLLQTGPRGDPSPGTRRRVHLKATGEQGAILGDPRRQVPAAGQPAGLRAKGAGLAGKAGRPPTPPPRPPAPVFLGRCGPARGAAENSGTSATPVNTMLGPRGLSLGALPRRASASRSAPASGL